jgi:CubicO group peptidase (beta-lactamase class C family)
MRKKVSFILLVVMILCSAFPSWIFAEEQSNQGLYAGIKEAAQKKADTFVQGYGAVSVQYALISDGEMVLSGHSGVLDRSDRRPITAETMYGIGSVSKMFTTAAVMRLSDQGKIRLDEPVTRYLPDFTMADERYSEITVRMLLNHSSGLMGSSFTNPFLLGDYDSSAKDSLLETLSTQRLKADPGAYSVYCNDGFTLAELIVEKVSGMSFTEYIHQNFIDPLDMDHTKTPAEEFDQERLAKTYLQGFSDATPRDTVTVIGTGGIYSTAEDLCRFSQIFMKKPEGQANNLLSGKTAASTMEKEYEKGIWPAGEDGLLGYGLGWDHVNAFPFNQYEIQAAYKGGDTLLYHGALIVLPEYNMAMAVLSSSGVSTYSQAFAQSILLEVLKAEGHIPEIKGDVESAEPVKAEMPKELINFSGLYASGEMIMRAEISTDGSLYVTIPAMPSYPVQKMIYTAEGIFRNQDGSGAIGFAVEENGKTYMINRGYNHIAGLGQIAVNEYMAQKTEPVKLTDSAAAAWDSRNEKLYYAVNEKYSSQAYATELPMAGIGFLDEAPGYLGSEIITDENNARAFVEIPGTAGRDLSDTGFMKENGREYMLQGSTILISEDYVTDLYTAGNAVCTIAEDGYARWYHVGPKDTGKTMTVALPENGAVAVYDEDQTCMDFTWITGNHTLELPEKGMVVFIGDPGVRFDISCQ